jgi:hypothetical protein
MTPEEPRIRSQVGRGGGGDIMSTESAYRSASRARIATCAYRISKCADRETRRRLLWGFDDGELWVELAKQSDVSAHCSKSFGPFEHAPHLPLCALITVQIKLTKSAKS